MDSVNSARSILSSSVRSTPCSWFLLSSLEAMTTLLDFVVALLPSRKVFFPAAVQRCRHLLQRRA
jgi:hypothetical protein